MVRGLDIIHCIFVRGLQHAEVVTEVSRLPKLQKTWELLPAIDETQKDIMTHRQHLDIY